MQIRTVFRYWTAAAIATSLLAATLLPASTARADGAGEQRAQIDRMAQQTLQALYAQQPSAARAIRESAGYAVFSDISTKIFMAGGGGGKGVAVDSVSGKSTYMMMMSVSAGLGFGVSKNHLVWVFATREAYDNFINTGVEIGTDLDLTVNPNVGENLYAGAVEAAPGAWLFQLSDAGLALELTVQGTKYFKDPELN